jgi:hypothetical protein
LEERSVSTDDQDIFDSEVPAQTTEGVSPEAPESPPRDEQGRFAAKDTGETPAPASEPAAAVTGAPPAPAEKRHDVPITALLDEREKRQRVEAELAAIRRQIQSQQQPQPLPDPVEDAEGYTRSIQQTFQQQLDAQRLQFSQLMAEQQFGPEVVGEAMAYFDAQPLAVSAQFLRERSPFHAAVQWFQRQKEVEERSSPDFEAKLREKIRAELLAESPPSARPNVPRSLAEAPSAAAPPPKSGDPLFD